MQQEEINSPHGNNFENHPILSKLSSLDRLMFSAELASEINVTYAKGYNDALVNVGNLIREVGIYGEEHFDERAQVVLFMLFNMVQRLNEYFLEQYRNQGGLNEIQE